GRLPLPRQTSVPGTPFGSNQGGRRCPKLSRKRCLRRRRFVQWREDEQEARSACLGLVRAGDDPVVCFVAHGLVEASAARRRCVGALVSAAAGKRPGSGRDRAEAKRRTLPASRRRSPAARAAASAEKGNC